MSEKSLEEQIKVKAEQGKKLARYMSSTRDLVESQIEKALKRGDFNNLEGHGKPLSLETNPFEPPEMRMVNKILKDNDYAPYWIEMGKEVDAKLASFHQEIERFEKYAVMYVSEKRSQAAQVRFENRKAGFYTDIKQQLERIDKLILDYNLHCPTFRVGRPQIEVDDEINKIVGNIERIINEANDSPE